MRFLWADSNNDCDWAKAQANKFTGIFYPVTDPIGDLKRRVKETSEKGFTPGVYMAWNWPQFAGLTGVGMAELMHQMVAQVEQGGVPVKVQFDHEGHTPEDFIQIRGMLTRWRALRPTKDTSWTLEGHQGGAMPGAEWVQAIIRTKTRVVPQCYDAPMENVWCPLEMARDLTKRGFPDSLISPFHDAAKLPQWWQGFAFTAGRLP